MSNNNKKVDVVVNLKNFETKDLFRKMGLPVPEESEALAFYDDGEAQFLENFPASIYAFPKMHMILYMTDVTLEVSE